MKKAMVTKVTKFDKTDSYGNSSFSIEFANGDKGFYSTKSPDQTKFIVGADAEYQIEEKEGKTGKKYFKITLPQTDQPFKAAGRPQIEPRIQMISFAMAYAKDLVVAGKVEMKALPATFDIIYGEMISKI
jgi:hypothetical protein